MLIATTCSEVRAQVAAWKEEGLTVGLVPTMGYLHEGHASLVEEAVRQCDRVVGSDFVNPTQFGPNEDLEAYPRDFRRDCAILEAHGCHLVFHPTVEEMYPPDAATYVEMLSEMPKQLCGKTRPIHFRGVCTVVAKLFNIVTPNKAFFGQKDAQQLAILRRMVRDLSYGITLVGCPKLDDVDYSEKLTQIIRENNIQSVTVVRMEVPCCGGLERAAKVALQNSGKFIPWQVITISIDGNILSEL